VGSAPLQLLHTQHSLAHGSAAKWDFSRAGDPAEPCFFTADLFFPNALLQFPEATCFVGKRTSKGWGNRVGNVTKPAKEQEIGAGRVR